MASDPSVTSLGINVWYTRTMKLMIILSVLLMAMVVDALSVGSKQRSGQLTDADNEDETMEGDRGVTLTPAQEEELRKDLQTKIEALIDEERKKYGL